MPKNPECIMHPEPERKINQITSSNCNSWGDILANCSELLKSDKITIYLPYFILLSWKCPNCGHQESDVFQISLSDSLIHCSKCDEIVVPTFANSITGDEGWLHYSPSDMGFPTWSWINVVSANEKLVTVELNNQLQGLDLTILKG